MVNQALSVEPDVPIVIKSTIPVGFTTTNSGRLTGATIFFSPEFLREGRALHDNLYPSRIVVGDESDAGQRFADLMVEGAAAEQVPVLTMTSSEAKPSSCSPTPTSRFGWPTSMSSIPMRRSAGSIRPRSSKGSGSTLESAEAATTTRRSGTAATAYQKTPSNCSPTTRTFRRT